MSVKSSSTRKKATVPKPGRPPKTPGYKPFWHSRGGWTIKIDGKGVYLGRDATKAEAKFRDKVLPNIRTGHQPNADRLTLGELIAAYLGFHESRVSTGQLSEQHFKYYRYGCKAILRHLGSGYPVEDIRPLDVAPVRDQLIQKYAPHTAEKYIRTIRSLLTSAHKSLQLIDAPVRFGDGLKAPDARAFRKHEYNKGRLYLEADEIVRLLNVSDARWQAMILLGYFAGFYPGDLAELPIDKLQLGTDDGWLDWNRPKTLEHRRAYLPRLLVRPLKHYLEHKPQPNSLDGDGYAFLNNYGDIMSSGAFSQLVKRHFKKAGITGVSFRYLRNACATYGDQAGDARALSLVMGHRQGTSGHTLGSRDTTGLYVKAIDDERLKAIGCYLEKQLLDAMEAVQ